MKVAPGSIIHILKNVPINNTYRDTLYFENESQQENYFISKKKYSKNNYTYLRKEEQIRVDILADDLLDCNYIMFKNASFGNKWFYAFITNVEYVNNSTSAISYVIDVMQTWAFDYELQRCFVEREHTTTDIIGENLIDDNLEVGEYKFEYLERNEQLKGYNKIVIAATFKKQGGDIKDAEGEMYGGIYSGLHYNVCNIAEDANTLISDATEKNKQDGIVNVYMVPEPFVENQGSGSPTKYEIFYPKYHAAHNGTIDGYLPKNKKLFTFPYCMLYVTNNNGTSANFQFEYFADENCKFNIYGLMNSVPQILAVPLYYKGVPENFNERMMLKDFPQCAYNIDSFKAYLAQNATQLGTGVGIGLITAGFSMASNFAASNVTKTALTTAVGSPIPYAGVDLSNKQTNLEGPSAGLAGTAMLLARMADKATLPPQARGGESGAINTALFKNMFDFYYCFIRQEYAIQIDNYWTVYGYPCKRVKVPNRNARPHWTFTKTVDCLVTGNVPAYDLSLIKSIFDNGITFWKNPEEVGHYELDNRPVNKEGE